MQVHDLCELAVRIMRSPMTWVCFTSIHLILAIFIGEMVSVKWRETAIWLPLGLLAALAMRPWPTGPSIDSSATAPVTAMVYVRHAYYEQDGLYHEDWCERLRGRTKRLAAAEAFSRGLGACPDCTLHTAE